MVARSLKKNAGILTIATLCLSLFGAGALAPAAMAQRTEPVTPERLSRIETAIRDLQGVVYSAEGNRFDPTSAPSRATIPGPDSAAATLTVRVSQIERELQTLTGEVERLTYQMEQNSRRLDTLTEALSVMNEPRDAYGAAGGAMAGEGGLLYEGDLQGSGDNGARLPSGTSSPARRPADGSPSDLRGTGLPPGVESPFPVVELDEAELLDPDETYETAYDALFSGQYAEAEAGFTDFLDAFPEDPRAADAQYRLGEIYLATGANSRAAVAFLDHIKNWPEDVRAPESYLKLGISYSRLEKTSEACQIFSVMESKFPDLSPALSERLSIERGKAGC